MAKVKNLVPAFLIRMRAEADELGNKAIKLRDFIDNNPKYREMDRIESMLMDTQLHAMCAYHDALACRIEIINGKEN